MTAMFPSPVPGPSETVPLSPPEDGLTGLDHLGALADLTGRSIVDLAGFLHQIDADASTQLGVVDHVSEMAGKLSRITQEMNTGLETVSAANAQTLETVEGSVSALRASADDSRDVAGWVGQLDSALGNVEATLSEVRRANDRIAEIAKQVNILAVNARIEAARAGDMGRGFAVVAEAINSLSQETSQAASDVTGSTGTLNSLIGNIRGDAREVSSRAEGVLAGAAKADAALNEISTQVSAASADNELLAVTAKGVANAVQDLTPAFQRLAQGLRATVSGVHQANSRAEEIVDISERAVQVAVQLGAANADGFMIELVQDNAATISAQFEAALQSGVLNEAQLFSSTYAAIPGTDPQQVVAPFTEFTDRILPAIQEPILGKHPRIVFCAAVDRNGYLPTHNAAFSRPQTTDPVWNAAHSRNRRVFDDRVGLKSGRNTQPFLMQTYRRDMGGGTFVLMKDVSAPIFVRGRHWGGLRMGFKPAE